MEQGYWTDIVSATGWERKGSREDVLPGKFKGEREIKRERERRRKEEEEERKEAKKQGEMEGVKDWEPLPTDCYKSECITNASFTALTRSMPTSHLRRSHHTSHKIEILVCGKA